MDPTSWMSMLSGFLGPNAAQAQGVPMVDMMPPPPQVPGTAVPAPQYPSLGTSLGGGIGSDAIASPMPSGLPQAPTTAGPVGVPLPQPRPAMMDSLGGGGSPGAPMSLAPPNPGPTVTTGTGPTKPLGLQGGLQEAIKGVQAMQRPTAQAVRTPTAPQMHAPGASQMINLLSAAGISPQQAVGMMRFGR